MLQCPKNGGDMRIEWVLNIGWPMHIHKNVYMIYKLPCLASCIKSEPIKNELDLQVQVHNIT